MTGMDGFDVAIIGAGIGGLAAAHALIRQGVRCRVFEREATLREIGAGIQLAPNATRLLHRFGLADALAGIASRPTRLQFRRWEDHSLLSDVDLAGMDDQFGAPYYTVHRGELQRVLLESLPPGTVELGRRCVGVRGDGPVRVLFEGSPAVTARVVIAADGIRSTLREQIAVDQPRYSGQSIFRGLVPAGLAPPGNAVTLWIGPGQHAVRHPVSGGRLISFAATAPAPDWTAESWTATGNVHELLDRYDGWTDELRLLLKSADSVSRWALHDRDPIDTWVDGSVALLGDAAHPMLPFMAQGANQAIEDAAVLAGCLRTEISNDALLAYQRIRQCRTSRIQEASRNNTTMFHLPDGPAQRERDVAMSEEALDGKGWIHDYDAEAETEPVAAG